MKRSRQEREDAIISHRLRLLKKVCDKPPDSFEIVDYLARSVVPFVEGEIEEFTDTEEQIISCKKSNNDYKWVIYILLCACGKYYVGKSLTMENFRKRFLMHQNGHGAAWTTKYPA